VGLVLSKVLAVAEIMKFNGPAPELINGRLAMIGFFAAVGAELATHRTIFQQVSST
jgi:Chlorophyll A-B binding protein